MKTLQSYGTDGTDDTVQGRKSEPQDCKRHWTEIIKVMQQAAHIQNQRQWRNVETASLQKPLQKGSEFANQAASLGLAFLVQAAQDTCIAEVT